MWTKEIYLYSIHIIDDLLIYVNKKEILWDSFETGKELLVQNHLSDGPRQKLLCLVIIFISTQKKRHCVSILEMANLLRQSSAKILNKDLGIVLDQFQININNIPEHTNDSSGYTGDGGVGFVGGDV